MIDIPTDAYILNKFFLTSSRFPFSIENLIGGYTSVFFPVNIKSAREPHFFEEVHGHNFAFTGTFSENSRASGCVHGHFLGLFHGHFSWFTGRKFGNVHGHFSRFTGTFSSKLPKMQEFACSRALLAGSRALFSENVHGHF